MGLQWEKKIIQEYQGEVKFDELAGRKNWINYFRTAVDPEMGSCLLFTGEPHLGKKTLIRSAAGEWKSDGYEAYEVYGEDLSRDQKTLREQMETIYDKVTTGKKILLLYSLDKIKTKEARTTLAFGLEQIQHDAESTAILATAQNAQKLSERLLKLFTICPVSKFREEELNEVMKGFLDSFCPETEKEQKEIRESLKERNCWELERIANLAVNYAILELTTIQQKSLEEVQELLEDEKIKVTPEQIRKAAEDVDSVRWKKEAKEHIYTERFIERPIEQQVQEKTTAITQSYEADKNDLDSKITPIDGLESSNGGLEKCIEEAEKILEEPEPTMDDMMELLKQNGQYKESTDLSEILAID